MIHSDFKNQHTFVLCIQVYNEMRKEETLDENSKEDTSSRHYKLILDLNVLYLSLSC